MRKSEIFYHQLVFKTLTKVTGKSTDNKAKHAYQRETANSRYDQGNFTYVIDRASWW